METIQSVQENKILIIDDDKGVCESLSALLKDQGFVTSVRNSAVDCIEVINQEKPQLVILDIWMPEMDGMLALEIIKKDFPNLPIIMISGHATISTAIKATKIGAFDFIEKPIKSSTILNTITNALNKNLVNFTNPDCHFICQKIDSKVFAGLPRKQKTIKGSVIIYGHGVHSGEKSGLVLEPLPENSGIHFVNLSDKNAIPAHLDHVVTTSWATTIQRDKNSVSTVEHLMSALHAYGITNLLVKCNNEVPVLDGSSIQFCDLLDEVGVAEQSEDICPIKVPEKVRIGTDQEFIEIEPADSLMIDYTLSYPAPLGTQHLTFEMKPEDYKREIASARTFGFLKDIDGLQKSGLAQGGRFNNFVLYDQNGAINSELRYPDEAVRHKILDLIGDIYLLGRPVVGKITAKMTGHSDNIKLITKINEMMRSNS